MNVLIVEDERRIASFVARGLSREGYAVQAVADGDGAVASVAREAPGLVLLDVMLPGRDGIAVLRELLATNPALPVMMLSARSDPETKVAALRAGAIDYVAKPFSFDELLERVRIHLRRSAELDPTVLSAHGVTLELRRRLADFGEGPVHLTDREALVLEYLMRHQDEVVSRERLLSAIWGYSFDTETNTVDVCVRRLRLKIGHERIATIRGAGYQLCA
ncbi:MAG TPA: response regulator transcription factor [Gaiellales bacterium]|nr:response regulator transcription factor [Gaiellales bacterium]